MNPMKRVSYQADETWAHPYTVHIEVEWLTGYADTALARFDKAVAEIRRQIADVEDTEQ